MQGTVLKSEGFCTASNDCAGAPEQMIWNGHDVDALLHALEARLEVRAIDVNTSACQRSRTPSGVRKQVAELMVVAADGSSQRQGYRRAPERQRGGSVEVLLPKDLPRIPTRAGPPSPVSPPRG